MINIDKYNYLLPAKAIIVYLIWGLLVFPFFTYPAGWYMRIEYILFDETGGLIPFVCSFILSSLLFSVGIYLLYRFSSKTFSIIFLYVYLLIYSILISSTIFIGTEKGWGALIFMTGMMFYSTKYSFVSNVLILITIIMSSKISSDNFAKWKIREYDYLTKALIISYFILTASFPYLLNLNDIKIMENQNISIKDRCTNIKKIDNCLRKFNYNINYSFTSDSRIKDVNFREVEHMPYRKQNNNLDKCFSSDYSVDEYKGFKAYIKNVPQSIIVNIENGKNGIEIRGGKKKYSRSRPLGCKDLVLFEKNSEYHLLVPVVEYIYTDSSKNNMLVTCNIVDYKLSNTTNIQHSTIYTFSFFLDANIIDSLHISLDRRDNPEYIYINVNNKNFESTNLNRG